VVCLHPAPAAQVAGSVRPPLRPCCVTHCSCLAAPAVRFLITSCLVIEQASLQLCPKLPVLLWCAAWMPYWEVGYGRQQSQRWQERHAPASHRYQPDCTLVAAGDHAIHFPQPWYSLRCMHRPVRTDLKPAVVSSTWQHTHILWFLAASEVSAAVA
jgi:hypothetical protein